MQLLCETFPEVPNQELYAWILCGEVYVDNEKIRDPKQPVSRGARIERRHEMDVGRGASKLRSVLEQFVAVDPRLNPDGKVVLDAGSSTGGFVQVLLDSGAKLVYAVDVGTNQLDFRLRQNSRVRVMERTNILSVESADLDPQPDFCTADLSFRSLGGAAGRLCELSISGLALALVKPQFERAYYARSTDTDALADGFSGVVDDAEVPAILADLERRLSAEGVSIVATVPSGVRGTSGNQELFALLRRT